jgi:CSLREA domain-containing protein
MKSSSLTSGRARFKRWMGFVLVAGLSLTSMAWGASFVVNTGADTSDANPGNGACADSTGHCSLRAAIEEGNALMGATRLSPHTITFTVPEVDISNGSFPTMMAPFVMTGPVYINGAGNGTPLSCLSLMDSGTVSLGYTNGANGSIISLISIGNCGSDAISANGHGYHFFSNHIGVDVTGLIKLPNGGNGITLSASHVYGNVDTTSLDSLFQTFPQIPVNGTDIQTFVQNLGTKLATLDPDTINLNVISGNAGDGVNIHSENLGAVFVTSNMIGTDTTGTLAIGNGGAGINLNGNTFANVISANVISGNVGNGVTISGTVYLPNYIMGNIIGPPAATVGAHVGNGMSGINTDTKPDSSMTNFNPSMISAIIGPANFISDNQGAPNSTDPDVLPTGGAGVYITGSSNAVKLTNNTIGMVEIPAGSAQDSNAYGNAGDGVIVTANGNSVTGNVIAGNKRHGIVVSSTNATSTHITGNTIGLYPAFSSDMTLGNGFDGVHIDDGSSTSVGGPNAGDGNTIVANGRNGVKILNGDLTAGWANLVQANTIYGNARGNPMLPPGGGIAVDLDEIPNAPDGPHPENQGNGANLDQAPPIICVGAPGEQAQCAGFKPVSSAGGMTTVQWTIATHGPATFRAEFYKIDTNDDNTATGITLLGTQQINTLDTGLPDPASCPAGLCTATLSGNAAGAFVMLNVTDVTGLLSTPGSTGWTTGLTCFFGDNGIILSACTANNTSEFSNVAPVLSSDASLSNLAISDGSLMPTFASTTHSYTDSVTNAVTSVELTPATSDPNAMVTVNGTTVASGAMSNAISLSVGSNNINVVVTAQDGVTMQTYTVVVNRAGPLGNDASLSALSISSGTLMPNFATTTVMYSDSVANAVASVTVTAATSDPNATLKINGTAVSSGTPSSAITLAVGANDITVVVTAQDETTMQTYAVAVNRAGASSNVASLSGLSISAGTLAPSFASTTLSYTDAVLTGTTSVTVTPTTSDSNATVAVNGTAVTSGTMSAAIALGAPGSSTPITIVVTAQDGTTMETYTVAVNRAGALSNNAMLSNVSISSGTLMPTFVSTTMTYSDSVANGVSSVTVTPTTSDTNATVKVNGTTVTSGVASGSIALAVGATNVNVVVTAQDGITTQTYTIAVNRAGALSNNAALSALAVSAGNLSPSFATATLGYTDAVTNATTSVTVTPTTSDSKATVTVNGASVVSGSPSSSIALTVGVTDINVIVTAQDGTTMQTYTIAVNRAGALSNNASLANLAVSGGSLTPSFTSTTLDYTEAVPNATTSVTVTPTTADSNATVTVNGTAVASGSASSAIALVVGVNNVSVVVTAQDGTTVAMYAIAVNRAGALSNDAALSNLAISSGALAPAFATATLGYTDTVSNATTSVTVTPTTSNANATVKVNGTTVASGSASGSIALAVGVTDINVVVTAQDGTTVETYTIAVNRAGALSNNAALSGLTVSAGSLTPTFASTTFGYSDAVLNATTSVTVTPTTSDATATVKVNGATVVSGSASGSITLAVGTTNVSVVVTAQDGTTTQTYTITVNRAGALSNNASLSNLAISSGSLSPSFAGATLSYIDAVPNPTASLTVTPTTADANATVTVNGTTVASNTASGSIALAIGVTNISVVVTAQDGTTVETYTVAVNRAGALSNNAALSNLSVSGGSLVPGFASNTLSYAESIGNAVTSVTITPTTSDSNATVKVNGASVTSGSPSGAIALGAPGSSTPITVVVTAQDGTSTQTYTVAVNRAASVVTTFSGMTFTNTGMATAVLSGGGSQCSFAAASFVGPPSAPPAGVNFPDGLFQFSTTGCTGSITMQVTFPTTIAANEKYWKFGPTPGPIAAHWYTLGAANTIQLSGHTAIFTITDGALGDDDLSVNGKIVDAGGPGTGSATAVGVTPTPSLTGWGLFVLCGALTLVGAACAPRKSARSRRRA